MSLPCEDVSSYYSGISGTTLCCSQHASFISSTNTTFQVFDIHLLAVPSLSCFAATAIAAVVVNVFVTLVYVECFLMRQWICALGSLTGTALQQELRTLISGHVVYSYSAVGDALNVSITGIVS